MDFNTLIWTPQDQKFLINELIDTVEFPQLLKISRKEGVNAKTGFSFNEGDLLKLHGVKSFKKAILKPVRNKGVRQSNRQSSIEVHRQYQETSIDVASEYGCLTPLPNKSNADTAYSVPISFSKPLQILPYREKSHVFNTVGDIIDEKPRPSAVVVNKTIQLFEKNTEIKAGDILGIQCVDKRCTRAGVVDYLICKHNDKTIGLPTSCVGNFTILTEETLHNLSSVMVRQMELPQRIRFIDTKPAPSENGNFMTLSRAGEALLDTAQDYILEAITKREYLVCTKCDAKTPSVNQRVYFLPLNGQQTQNMAVQLPLFRDIKTYRNAVNNSYCANLSMKKLVDNSPIEINGEPVMFVCRLSDLFFAEPALPPRSREHLIQDGREAVDFNNSPYVNNVKAIHSRSASEDNTRVAANCKTGFDGSPWAEGGLTEEQPLLTRSGVVPPSMNQGRKGSSTPSTPEYKRKKNRESSPHGAPSTWSEKISISLENLKKSFRKGGSEERDTRGKQRGDGSALAGSFENLSVSQNELSTSNSSEYMNFKQIAGNQAGRKLKYSAPASGIPPSKCAQIKELWTPPCSPDYRDHTTTTIDSLNQLDHSTRFSFSSTPGHSHVNKPPAPEPMRTVKAEPVRLSDNEPPKAAPRTSRSPPVAPRSTSAAAEPIISLYENIQNIEFPSATTPPSRCSGYSSGGSEGDLANMSVPLEHIKSLDAIPEDLSSLTVAELGDCLHLFELHLVAGKFRQHQIDGQFFVLMPDEMFKDESFGLTDFEILKLKRLRAGWRPKF